MDLTLTTTWHPRGEMERIVRLLPNLGLLFHYLIIILPPEAVTDRSELSSINELKRIANLRILQTTDWAGGRYAALQAALDTPADFIVYADLDRLLRWYEIHPQELQIIADQVMKTDCLIVGRSASAYQTHPKALIQTELISNAVVSYFLGRDVDVSAGCKGFSRRGAEFLVGNTTPQRAFGTDAEWPLLLLRAGYRIDYIVVDGLDWESADRYRITAADPDRQKHQAQMYDENPENWAQRVEVAWEIVRVALEVQERKI